MESVYYAPGYSHDFEALELLSTVEILDGLKVVSVKAKAVDDHEHDLKIQEIELLSVLRPSGDWSSKVVLAEEMADTRKSGMNRIELAEGVSDRPCPISFSTT